MELKVVTSDGRRGVLATPALQANAFRPVEVRFPDGERAQYYLRELRIDADVPAAPSKPQRRPQGH